MIRYVRKDGSVWSCPGKSKKHYFSQFQEILENRDLRRVWEQTFSIWKQDRNYNFNARYWQCTGVEILPVLRRFARMFDRPVEGYIFKKSCRTMDLDDIFEAYERYAKRSEVQAMIDILENIPFKTWNGKTRLKILRKAVQRKHQMDYLSKVNEDREWTYNWMTRDLQKYKDYFESTVDENGVTQHHPQIGMWFSYPMGIKDETYDTSGESWRLYHPMTGMSSDVRRKTFHPKDGFVEIDLSQCHLQIFRHLTGFKLDRDQLVEDSKVPKDVVKQVINATLYGAGRTRMRDSRYYTINEDGVAVRYKPTKGELDRIFRDPNYKALVMERKKLAPKFLDTKIWEKHDVIKPNEKKVRQMGGKNLSQTLAHYFFTFIERVLMTSLIPYIKKKKMKIVVDSHDGATLWFPPKLQEDSQYYVDVMARKIRDNQDYPGITTLIRKY